MGDLVHFILRTSCQNLPQESNLHQHSCKGRKNHDNFQTNNHRSVSWFVGAVTVELSSLTQDPSWKATMTKDGILVPQVRGAPFTQLHTLMFKTVAILSLLRSTRNIETGAKVKGNTSKKLSPKMKRIFLLFLQLWNGVTHSGFFFWIAVTRKRLLGSFGTRMWKIIKQTRSCSVCAQISFSAAE